jgi:hypothetical protein
VDACLSPHRIMEDDFVELMTQLCHEMLNQPHNKVLQEVGPHFPNTGRMIDTCYDNPQMAHDLEEATRMLVRYAVYELESLDLFEEDGTLSYAVHGLFKDHIILDYLPY